MSKEERILLIVHHDVNEYRVQTKKSYTSFYVILSEADQMLVHFYFCISIYLVSVSIL